MTEEEGFEVYVKRELDDVEGLSMFRMNKLHVEILFFQERQLVRIAQALENILACMEAIYISAEKGK
jgi:hypothetical protein